MKQAGIVFYTAYERPTLPLLPANYRPVVIEKTHNRTKMLRHFTIYCKYGDDITKLLKLWDKPGVWTHRLKSSFKENQP
jgi:hypothetical protein